MLPAGEVVDCLCNQQSSAETFEIELTSFVDGVKDQSARMKKINTSRRRKLMKSRKIFNCQRCDGEIEITEPQEQNQVICRGCGQTFQLHFSQTLHAWILQAEQTVDVDTDKRPEEEPFSVLGEVGRPKRIDRSEDYREETDLHPSDEAAVDITGRKG